MGIIRYVLLSVVPERGHRQLCQWHISKDFHVPLSVLSNQLLLHVTSHSPYAINHTKHHKRAYLSPSNARHTSSRPWPLVLISRIQPAVLPPGQSRRRRQQPLWPALQMATYALDEQFSIWRRIKWTSACRIPRQSCPLLRLAR